MDTHTHHDVACQIRCLVFFHLSISLLSLVSKRNCLYACFHHNSPHSSYGIYGIFLSFFFFSCSPPSCSFFLLMLSVQLLTDSWLVFGIASEQPWCELELPKVTGHAEPEQPGLLNVCPLFFPFCSLFFFFNLEMQ